ncbi:MAG: ankyrin repeat domain-containing protein, partial [Candidatus Brocadiia bacterium]|nr:ankyrin repeat domain-containing protein [Candidatus Brocadiia bacterium]
MKRRWLWMFAAVLLVAVLGSGCSPRDGEIHEAVESGDIARVQELLAATPGLVNARGATRQTPLHVAAFEGQSEIAELLVARGADVDAKSWTGETPLARAALFVRMEIAELLLENGADVNARNVTGMTPLHWAVYLGFQDD